MHFYHLLVFVSSTILETSSRIHMLRTYFILVEFCGKISTFEYEIGTSQSLKKNAEGRI